MNTAQTKVGCRCGMSGPYKSTVDEACKAWNSLSFRQWRPMKDAPRDGTDIIVYDGDVRTISTFGKTAHVPIYGFLKMAWSDPYDADLMDPEPSHWMPLPDPPEDE